MTFAVSANDAVDGPLPVTCAPASGAVSRSASPRSPAPRPTGARRRTSGKLSFPVVVSQQGGPPLGAPTLTPPTGPVEATGPGGAPLAVTATTSGGAPLTPVVHARAGRRWSRSERRSSPAPPPTRARGSPCSAASSSSFATRRRRRSPVPGDPAVAGPGGVRRTRQLPGQRDRPRRRRRRRVLRRPPRARVFPLGATVVVCRAVDKAGNQAFARFKVTVTDQGQVTLHLADPTVDADDSTGARVSYSPYATDISGNPVAIDCVPPSGTHAAARRHDRRLHRRRRYHPRGARQLRRPRRRPVAPDRHRSRPDRRRGGQPEREPPSRSPPARATWSAASWSPTAAARPGSACRAPSRRARVFPIGDNLVTCTATDAAGNVGIRELRRHRARHDAARADAARRRSPSPATPRTARW